MRKAKKIALISVASLLILILLGLLLFFILFPVTIKADYSLIVPFENNVAVFEINGTSAVAKIDEAGNITDEDFKIVAFADTHFDHHKQKVEVSFEMLMRNISFTKPDLVVFMGDIVTSTFNRWRAKQLAEVMESFGVYWTLILGNHEGEHFTGLSRKNMIQFFSVYPHCLIDETVKYTSDGEVVWGYGNYYLNILKSNGEVRQTLFFLDSGERVSEDAAKELDISDHSYDFLKPSQIQWYKESVDALTSTKSMVFCHIPLCEFADAYQDALDGQEHATLVYGLLREEPKSSQYNSGMFDAILEKDHTQAFITAHDHCNDCIILYHGIYLGYCRTSGYSKYDPKTANEEGRFLQGCSIYMIDKDGNIAFNSIINDEHHDQSSAIALYK
ncbi:MAG: metallophosphoesterase [Clostridia bacterium]|nr:metallophosphoesterase [Clostridia bacterium]